MWPWPVARPCHFGTTQDLGDALKAAMAEPGPAGYGVGPTSSQLPGASAQTGAGVPPAGVPPAGVPPVAMQTPEEAEQNKNNICEKWKAWKLKSKQPLQRSTVALTWCELTGTQVVRALLQIAGADAGQPPPEILGTALQASGRDILHIECLQVEVGPVNHCYYIYSVPTWNSKNFPARSASDTGQCVASAACCWRGRWLPDRGGVRKSPEVSVVDFRWPQHTTTIHPAGCAEVPCGSTGTSNCSASCTSNTRGGKGDRSAKFDGRKCFKAPSVYGCLSFYYGTYGTPFAYSAYSFHVPWLRQVIFALRMAAGPGAGTPPPEVVGAALHQAKVLHGLGGLSGDPNCFLRTRTL